ncbi:MAG: molybdopterin-dependent oxidoreductase [Ardenticatenaceae bacterium]|nr:molybdopterin-dependent oxidoreductase [Ardenticatenaceae bacterium]
MSEFRIIGRSWRKIDAVAKTTGATKYADDIILPRMVYAKLLRSIYPHARLRSIDVEPALRVPGVLAVITGRDLPIHYGVLANNEDETALAIDRVRYIGEPVAAVAAVDEATAEHACGLIRVEYEPLEPILTIEDALRPDAGSIHEWTHRPNVHKLIALEFGDLEAAFAAADYVREDTFFYEGSNHVALEQHAAVAHFDEDGKLTLWSGTQVPHYLHRALSKVLEIPSSHIRVIVPGVGGGFGGKSEPLGFEFCVAELSRRTGRPVKISLTREEVFYTHRGRHPARMWLKTGVKADGTLTGLAARIFLDGGAYSSFGIATTFYVGSLLPLTYKLPAYQYEGMRVFTNKPACGPKRGHGAPQPRYAWEIQLDKIAEDLAIDPIELRLRNLIEPYSTTMNSLRVTSCGLRECLEKVAAASGWYERRQKLPPGKGLGIAVSSYLSGTATTMWHPALPHSGAYVQLDRDGGVTVFCGSAEIGQGSYHLLAAIVAEELGLYPEDVRVVAGDTGLTPVDLGSYSSRVTFMSGNAVLQAVMRVREQLFAAAGEVLEVPPEKLAVGEYKIYDTTDPTNAISYVDAVVRAEARFGTLGATGSYFPPRLGGKYRGAVIGTSPAYSYTACVAEVSCDLETGELKVDRMWVAHDCGRALNPALVAGQIHGCAYMGLGEALMEAQTFDKRGLHLAPSLLEYHLPTSLETPEIEAIIVEAVDAEGPYGAKEAGEGPEVPIVPAISNAVYQATGVRFDDIPLHAHKVYRALNQQSRPSGQEIEVPDYPFPDPERPAVREYWEDAR